MEKTFKRGEHLFLRWLVFTLGLIIMAFGIALMIRAELGSAPWDVLHVGLHYQLGLTVGTWSILIGVIIITATSILEKEWPQVGGIVNMLTLGIFIDIFLFFVSTPESFLLKFVMLIAGILLIGYGIGVYIAPQLGAGPRDSLMIAIHKRTGWNIARVRGLMEIAVLIAGWLLGGPVFIGTIIYSFGIGHVVGKAMPQCQSIVYRMIRRGDQSENIYKRSVRSHHYDGVSEKVR